MAAMSKGAGEMGRQGERETRGQRNGQALKVLSVFGTRPEAIKLAPVIRELQRQSANGRLASLVCVTAQHCQMPDRVVGGMIHLNELRQRYRNEWIAVRLGPGGDRYRPERGYLLAHSPEWEVVRRAVMGMASGQEAYVFFNTAEGPRHESTLLIYWWRR